MSKENMSDTIEEEITVDPFKFSIKMTKLRWLRYVVLSAILKYSGSNIKYSILIFCDYSILNEIIILSAIY